MAWFPCNTNAGSDPIEKITLIGAESYGNLSWITNVDDLQYGFTIYNSNIEPGQVSLDSMKTLEISVPATGGVTVKAKVSGRYAVLSYRGDYESKRIVTKTPTVATYAAGDSIATNFRCTFPANYLDVTYLGD